MNCGHWHLNRTLSSFCFGFLLGVGGGDGERRLWPICPLIQMQVKMHLSILKIALMLCCLIMQP